MIDELEERRRSIERARSEGNATRGAIADSWDRCRPSLAVERSAAPVDAEPDEVHDRWAESPIRRANVGLEEALARAADAGDLVAAVTDQEGRILWSSGGRTMRRIAEDVAFIPGGRWDESSAGTNAVGLSLVTGRPSTVFVVEHWCEAVHEWVCWSAPVHDRNGKTIGIIDLSGRWNQAVSVAATTVEALARLTEEHLPDGVGAPPPEPTLEIDLLGHPAVRFGGEPVLLTQRQIELLAALALEGECTLDRLQWLVYGDRPVSQTTVKAELSHVRQTLGGAIGSRPYRLTVPVVVDALEVLRHLQGGRVGDAVEAYGGALLGYSDAPFAVRHRHVLEVSVREAVLRRGLIEELMRYARSNPDDEEILEHVIANVEADDPRRSEARAMLDLAQLRGAGAVGAADIARIGAEGLADFVAMTEPAPRIAPLQPDELDEQQAELLATVGGPAVNIFATLVRHPGLARRWMAFGGKLLAGTLPPRDRELLILRTGWRCGSEYEWAQHVLIGRDAGLDDVEIARIKDGPDAPGWSDWDGVVLRAADELHDDNVIGDTCWVALAERYDERQLIEVPMVVGQYHLVSFTLRSLGVPLEQGLVGGFAP